MRFFVPVSSVAAAHLSFEASIARSPTRSDHSDVRAESNVSISEREGAQLDSGGPEQHETMRVCCSPR